LKGDIIMAEMVKTQVAEDKIKISEEVVATIAGIAASEVGSLASMSGGLVDGIAGILGRKSMGRGIKVEIKENNNVYIEMSIIVQYGCKIHEVSREIQGRVREAVENMTGMQVTSVNINVLGITMEKESKGTEAVDEQVP
jgi:uncharacterized alkaline shock family protein YloU